VGLDEAEKMKRIVLAVLVVVLAATPLGVTPTTANASAFDGPIFYVPNADGSLRAYRVGSWEEVGSWQMPFSGAIRGSDVDPAGGYLYIAHGGTGGSHGTGSLLKWNLLTDSAEWDRSYSFGVDQFSYCGGRIYMPTGEASTSNVWQIIDAQTGNVIGSQTGGSRPHNTICHNGNVYMGGVGARYLITSGTTARKIGPTPSSYAGVRPFTVNADDTRTWITWTKYRGFSVANAKTGAILASVNFGPVPSTFTVKSPSHGISLAPDGGEVYVLDMPSQQVRVYSADDSPQLLATVPLVHPIKGNESPCFHGCRRVGWILHSRDGRYVFVGNSGDVIDTQTRSVVTHLPALANDRHGFVEVDWTAGEPRDTTSHFGYGR
jgi:hypothetical protein